MWSDERNADDSANSSELSNVRPTFLVAAEPGASICRVSRFVIGLSVVSLLVMAPFARIHLVRLPAFIPSYESALAFIDFVTAILLYSQFSILRRRSVLIVASAFALSALLVAAHALSFPAGTNLIGLYGDSQTTAWVYVIWHAAFPLSVLAYAILADSPRDLLPATASTGRSIVSAVFIVVGLAVALVALSANAEHLLPTLIVDGDYSGMVEKGISPLVLLECVLVIGLMWKRRRRTVLDVWLFSVLCVWICDVSLSAVIGASRYDLGWYSGRIFGLVGSSLVLTALLFELDKLYARIASSVSELEARNAELVRSRDVIARTQRFEALAQLTGGIAHDFNNLLTAITGGLEMITRQPSNAERVLRLAANATRAADRGSELIRRLMSFARKHNLHPESMDANGTLREFAALAANLPASGVTIRLELRDVGAICVDETEFQAAFLNLIGNARDAMPAGGEIVVSTRRLSLGSADLTDEDAKPGEFVEVAIADRGSGMAPEIQARIFEPFFTTKPQGTGTGLGLSQVYGFVRSAGGQITVESAEGRGTTIRLRLPRSADPHVEPDSLRRPTEPRAQGLSVLLVEDDHDVLVSTKDRVEELGYVVTTATSGDEAFELLSQGLLVDIVFSDIVMPGRLNGVQLAEAVRRIRPAQKLLLTSGYTGNVLDQFRPPTGLLFLSKPYSQKDLAEKLVAATTD